MKKKFNMSYLLVGDDHQVLYVECSGEYSFALCFSKYDGKWRHGELALFEARTGCDPYEPEESPYRWGNGDALKEIVGISKEEAEKFIGQKIDENELIDIASKRD